MSSKPWDSPVRVTRRKLRCGYCDKNFTGAYRWVDQVISCEKCNREYDYTPKAAEVVCPVCRGKGVLK
jgi:DNA-directed RNA polymerase subunit RPC12/RpoP